MSHPSSGKPDYSVWFDLVEPGYFRVVWHRGSLKYLPYLIDKGDVDVISKQIRAELKKLVKNALERERAVLKADEGLVSIDYF